MFEEYIANDWLRSGLIFLAVFIWVRLLIYVLSHVVPFFTKKTKTELDDIILSRVSGPFTLLALLAGIKFALLELRIREHIDVVVQHVMTTSMIFVGSVLVYYIIDAFIEVGYRDFGRKVRKKVNESLLQFFHSLLKIVVIVGAFLVTLASWGIEIGPLLAGLGVAGIAVAFALQSTLSNIFGGISMLLDRSISVGDMVNLDDGTGGHIMKINLRSTKIRTFDDELVIVPNGKLSESNIKNLALPTPITRVALPFGVAYGSDIAKVKKIALREVAKVSYIDKEKGVKIRFLEMGDSSLNFKVYFYVDSFDNLLDAKDEANTLIYEALGKAGIEIPFPQMDVHLKK